MKSDTVMPPAQSGLIWPFMTLCGSPPTKRIEFFSYFCKKKYEMGVLVGIALNLQITLGIAIILSLLVCEHKISLYLFISVFIYFINVLQFLAYESSASLVKFTHQCLMVFNAIVSRIVFLFLFSDISSLVYRNTTNFCMLILNPTTCCCNFLVDSRVPKKMTLYIFAILMAASVRKCFWEQLCSTISMTSAFPNYTFLSYTLCFIQFKYFLNFPIISFMTHGLLKSMLFTFQKLFSTYFPINWFLV